MDLALNNLQRLICHKTKQTKPTKQSDREVPVMEELWRMRSIPSLPSFPGPLRPGVVAPDRVLSMAQIRLNCELKQN